MIALWSMVKVHGLMVTGSGTNAELTRSRAGEDFGRGGGGEQFERDPEDDSASLDHLREAVTMYEDNARIARRVYGGAHPLVVDIEHGLRCARAALRARETPSSGYA